MLTFACLGVYFIASQCSALEFDLDKNKLSLIRNRRDESEKDFDLFHKLPMDERTYNDYSTTSQFPSVDVASSVSESSPSDKRNKHVENEDSALSSYFEGKF